MLGNVSKTNKRFCHVAGDLGDLRLTYGYSNNVRLTARCLVALGTAIHQRSIKGIIPKTVPQLNTQVGRT
jgi:hypothetical protein